MVVNFFYRYLHEYSSSKNFRNTFNFGKERIKYKELIFIGERAVL